MIYIFLSLAALIVVLFATGLMEGMGTVLSDRIFPVNPLKKGDRVHIFINGHWNRTTEVTAVTHSHLVIYNAIPCPVSYRGSFYAVGSDKVGNRLVYLSDLNQYRYVKAAELVRKVFRMYDYFDCLAPEDDNTPTETILSAIAKNTAEEGDAAANADDQTSDQNQE